MSNLSIHLSCLISSHVILSHVLSSYLISPFYLSVSNAEAVNQLFAPLATAQIGETRCGAAKRAAVSSQKYKSAKPKHVHDNLEYKSHGSMRGRPKQCCTARELLTPLFLFFLYLFLSSFFLPSFLLSFCLSVCLSFFIYLLTDLSMYLISSHLILFYLIFLSIYL